MIKKAELPGEALIALRELALECFPQEWVARCQIFVSRADLRTRLLAQKKKTKKGGGGGEGGERGKKKNP